MRTMADIMQRLPRGINRMCAFPASRRLLWGQEAIDDGPTADSFLRKRVLPKEYGPGPKGGKLAYTLGCRKATRRAPAWNQNTTSGGRAAVPQPNLAKSLEERHPWACCFVFWERFPSAF